MTANDKHSLLGRLAALAFAIAVTLCALVGVPTRAQAEVVDLSRTGSISATFRNPTNSEPVAGGVVALYRVATVEQGEGSADRVYVLTDDFAASGVELGDLDGSTLASQLATVVEAGGVSPVATATAGNDGKVTFGSLPLGVYLAVQTKAADGYKAVTPFVVSVPLEEDGVLTYDVDATPKMATLTQTTPDKPNTPEKPNVPEDGHGLVSTGDTLTSMAFIGGVAAVGAAVVIVGLIAAARSKKASGEK